eukprot:TRINITY_DN6147_c0_g1_i1.p1 TRINITY_DN6147_c0_g1~~TRINITY_DN6147_c0_g1_i1.p1  ORF type:complete len:149 (-),score=73.15 TRINITY_DN6147_c0_g1_i1:4-450(-)
MLLSILFWFLELGLVCINAFFQVFVVILLIDVETDYAHPSDACKKLNPIMLPEYIIHFLITFLLVLHGNYLEFFINLPLVVYHIHRLVSKTYRLDATQIVTNMKITKRISFIKIGFYLLVLFNFMIRLVLTIVATIESRSFDFTFGSA